jgi:hypothetical protein
LSKLAVYNPWHEQYLDQMVLKWIAGGADNVYDGGSKRVPGRRLRIPRNEPPETDIVFHYLPSRIWYPVTQGAMQGCEQIEERLDK